MFDIKKEAANLVAQMTLDEKVFQMMHTSPAVKRLDIPSYNWWSEALHGVARAGVATMFPQAIGLAATFDEELLFEVADVIATEGRAKYHAFQGEGDHDIFKGLTFWSPNINIFRDPRWGRGHETYGEDPYLTARLGVAFIKGLQGPDRNSLKTAACAKHFAVHSGPESIRHEFNAECSWYDLWNTYLPAFEAAVTEGEVESVMGAYNRTLGEPCCGSKLLLKDILRDKWGFDGHVVSDCWAIKDFHINHKVTRTAEESVAMAVSNGCDINCGNMFSHCLTAIQEGLLTEEQIDTAVTRLFVTRMRLGLMGAPENPGYTNIPYSEVDSPEHRALSLETSRRSLIMLKNDGCLPLDTSKIKTIGVIGPNADNRRALEGNYEGTASEHITPLMGVRTICEEQGIRVMYAQGSHLYKDACTNLSLRDDRIAEARIVAKESNAVIICLGLDADMEGEESDAYSLGMGGDKPNINLQGRQQELLEQVVGAAAGKPVILVMLTGSAMNITWAAEHVNGIFQAFYPGAYGGAAIAEAIFGRYSPEGKLPVTFYRSDKDLPAFTDYSMENRTYRYFKGKTLYPFGYGLGYSSFEAKNLNADKDRCSLTVLNIGKIAERQTVQVYVKNPDQKENHSLCGVVKVFLKPGEEKQVDVKINPDAFSRYDNNGDKQEIKGTHIIYAGFCQPDDASVKLTGHRPLQAEIHI